MEAGGKKGRENNNHESTKRRRHEISVDYSYFVLFLVALYPKIFSATFV
jgi:hypothetical protein